MDDYKQKLSLKQLKIPISVEYSLDEDVEILPVSFLGEEGMFAETTIDYPVGINLVIRFYVPEFDKVIEAVGEVVYRSDENSDKGNVWNVPGIFIKFKAIDGKDREILRVFLKNNAI